MARTEQGPCGRTWKRTQGRTQKVIVGKGGYRAHWGSEEVVRIIMYASVLIHSDRNHNYY